MPDPIYTAWSIPIFGWIVVGSLLLLIVGGFILQFAYVSDARRTRGWARYVVIGISLLGVLYGSLRLLGVGVTVLQGPRLITAEVTQKVMQSEEGRLGSAIIVLDDKTVVMLPQFGNIDQIKEGSCYHTILYSVPKTFEPLLLKRSPIALNNGGMAFSNSLVLELYTAHPYLCTLDLSG